MVNKDIQREEDLNEIKSAYKPRLFLPVYTSIICIAPYLHLLLDIVSEEYDRLLTVALIAAPTIAVIAVVWTRYSYQVKEYKKEVNDYLADPENYDW
ncbi:hypothetical protein SAMN05421736_110122 [Evansella caseinilytica]|uniref:Uncharacterized protein n=1 Tax=Evansella caseinilytica TaxID=1503961 RepID=A0A1H3SBC4_9BACI|nr:hypothetical protein [Evansella caseinilytica]SDZ35316.1 hypothetical protein SAMN05421736_110122 [Evansella caseinilytica]